MIGAARPATLGVRRFVADDLPGLERLNRRLAAAGLSDQIGSERLPSDDEPRRADEPIVERLFLAADASEIRGGVWLKEQLFWYDGAPLRVGWAKYPVAESLIDGAAAGVPASLLFRLLREQPRLMALGMGGHAGPFARILAAARWHSSLLPFFFRFLRPSRVLRHLSYARATRARRLVADALAGSGLGWAGHTLLSGALSATRPALPAGYTSVVVEGFDDWADRLWERCRDSYGVIALRDSQALNALYPHGFRCLDRLRVQRGGGDVGWICVRAIAARGTWFERQFGALRVGIITDALAQPEDATGVMAAGYRALVAAGVDLVVTYQAHPAWCTAARHIGFLPGPSNSAFYRSPAIEEVLAKAAGKNRYLHLTSSDGDGPEAV